MFYILRGKFRPRRGLPIISSPPANPCSRSSLLTYPSPQRASAEERADLFCPQPHLGRRRGGLMVSALNSGSSGPGSSPGRGTALCSWEGHYTLIVPLFTKMEWIPAKLLLGVTLRWTSIPSRGGYKLLHAKKTEISPDVTGNLALLHSLILPSPT